MTREDIDNIISIVCPNDEDFEKPIISPAYLKKELETLALEQEPCEDAIYRQAVLDGLAIIAKVKAKSDAQKSLMGRVMFFVEQLPPVTHTQRWISVGERLPEEGEVVLCTNSSNDLFEAYAWDDCGKTKWNSNGCFYVPVIAWMPLPEPYNADMRGTENEAN